MTLVELIWCDFHDRNHEISTMTRRKFLNQKKIKDLPTYSYFWAGYPYPLTETIGILEGTLINKGLPVLGTCFRLAKLSSNTVSSLYWGV